MTRVKRGICAHRKRHTILKFNRSYGGVHSRLFRQAHQQRIKALRSQFIGRKEFQRECRKLWIQRIQAHLRLSRLAIPQTNLILNPVPYINYSRFMNGIKLNGMQLNRKILSQLAILDPNSFSQLIRASMTEKIFQIILPH